MNVLVVRLSAMGDVVHALPLAANLSRAGHRVGWIVERPFAPLLEGHPGIESIFVVDTNRWRRHPFASATWRALARVRAELSDFAADVSLDPQANEKSLWVSRLTRAPRIVLDDRSTRASWTRKYSWIRVDASSAASHVVDKNLALLSPLAVPVVERRPDARHLLSQSGKMADVFLSSVVDKFALYHPGAGWPDKCWGEDRFAALAHEVSLRMGIDPVISWGPGDEDRAWRLAESLKAPRIPSVGFADLARIIAECRFFAAGDTGPLHLADALGVPTLALFGPTDPSRSGPYRSREQALFARLPCSPCFRRYNQTKACLSRIDPVAAVRSIADRRAGG